MTASATSADIRIANRRKVLRAVYGHKEISKQGISQALSMSLPTVTQNLKEIEAMGLIERRGLYESTGGRKAHIYHFVSGARIALGVVLLKEFYRIVAVDLYGNVLKSKEVPVPFSRTEDYFQGLGREIRNFAWEAVQKREENKEKTRVESKAGGRLEIGTGNQRESGTQIQGEILSETKAGQEPWKQQILGVSIAIQGLVSNDGSTVIYGEILGCTGLNLQEIQRAVDFPCTLIHDTEASAIAEMWFRKSKEDAVLLSLNRNFGGALIVNGDVHRGQEFSSSVIEHMRLYPEGRPCYCGKKGCMEAYCSANALQQEAGEPLKQFFEAMRSGCRERTAVWHRYLRNLAMGINNIRMLFDCEYIIGGYLHSFMEEQDFFLLAQYAKEECSFQSTDIRLVHSAFTDDSAAPGAGIFLVKRFLNSF